MEDENHNQENSLKNNDSEPSPNNEINKIESQIPNTESEEQVPIFVCNPIKREAMTSYFVYTLKVLGQEDLVFRRFSDFYSLREKLLEQWPGVFVPNIPPKKSVGNLDIKYVESRMKLLNKFCFKISKFQLMFNSEEMKIFLSKNIVDVKKALQVVSVPNYENLYLKYKAAFPDYYESFDVIAAKKKLVDFQIFLKKALANLRNFKDVVETSMEKKQQEIDNYLCLISVFSDYEKYTLLEYSENDDNKLVFFNPKNTELCLKLLKLKEGLDNPYTPLFDWLKEEEIDMEAMIDATSSLQTLNETADEMKEKINNLGIEIAMIAAGKITLKSMFSFKSKAEEKVTRKSEKANAEKNLIDLEGVIKLATYNLDSYIEYFKVEKLAGYYQNLKVFAELQKDNSSKINELWQTVGLDKNVQKLISNNNK